MRLLGELRKGFFGAEMVHPRYRVLQRRGAAAAVAHAGVPDHRGTAAGDSCASWWSVRSTLPTCPTRCRRTSSRRCKLPSFKQSIAYLHNPPPAARLEALEARTHPAWRRVKFDELLAQQLSMRLHHRKRQTVAAPRLTRQRELADASC